MSTARFVGVDVGAESMHAVVVESGGGATVVVDSLVVLPDEIGDLVDLARSADRVAIDAPGGVSRAVHRDDAKGTMPNKFKKARCGEIAVGVEHGLWVPWVTPMKVEETPKWMRAGFVLWESLVEAGVEIRETYPAGCFYALNGGAWPSSRELAAGLRRRLELLADLVALPDHTALWGPPAVDALLAALVASWPDAISCGHGDEGHDGTVMWLPPGRLAPWLTARRPRSEATDGNPAERSPVS